MNSKYTTIIDYIHVLKLLLNPLTQTYTNARSHYALHLKQFILSEKPKCDFKFSEHY